MNYGESRKPQGICEGAAWLSSARAVRCRLKCHNERNPCCQLLTGSAEDSDKTAIVRKQVDYVLGEWSSEEEERFPAMLKHCGEVIENFIFIGVDKTMSLCNNLRF